MKKSYLSNKKGVINAKTGMDLAFAAIFVLAIGLTIVDDTVSNLTDVPVNGTAEVTGTAGTVLGYGTLVVGAVFLYGIARMGGVL